MKLLVVTPTLGGSRWLDETVSSVKKNAPGARHVLVTRAESTASLQARFPHCSVLAEVGEGATAGGMYAAINCGLNGISDWDAFTYLNDDDLLLPGFARIIGALATISKAEQFAYGKVTLISADGASLGSIPVSHFPGQNRALYAERLEPVFQHGTVVTRAAWHKVGGFDERFRLCGDSEFLARLCVAGLSAKYVGCAVAAFRLHPNQLTKRRSEMERERDEVDRKLRLREGLSTSSRILARWTYRCSNAPVYLERIAKHGFVSFDTVLERGA